MEAPNIEVGILLEQKITFFLHGKFQQENSTDYLIGQCHAEWQPSGILFTNDTKQSLIARKIVLLPCNLNCDLAEIEEVRIGINFHWDERKKLQFQGSISLIWKEEGIQLINILPVENYLRSVISSEMSATSSPELLKAHAVVSRSWLMAQIFKTKEESTPPYTNPEILDDSLICWYDRKEHEGYQVCADDHCQRYYGQPEFIHPNVIRAIQETSGQVLMDGESFCDTRYSKCCGGITEKFENCWEPVEKKYLTAIADKQNTSGLPLEDLTNETNARAFIELRPEAFCNTQDETILKQVLTQVDRVSTDFFRWTKSYTQKEIANLLLQKTGIDFGKIMDLLPIQRGPSGRIIRLRVVGSSKSHTFGKELEIRRILSETHLYSSAFFVSREELVDQVPTRFILHGAGWGHGVGLCQIGAAVMGEKGYTHRQILEHYFKQVTLQKIY